ncbi:hypothetical protein FRB98_003597 [Tulasnella sp. 332]|nr:hypothetical protein FRB98_003597 [Tulasnella sp. 332]
MPAARTIKTNTTSKAGRNASKDASSKISLLILDYTRLKTRLLIFWSFAHVAKEPKEKRAPSAYNIFVKEQMPLWKAAHPAAPHSEAMKGIGEIWAKHADNPNKGQPRKERKPKATKAMKSNKTSSPAAGSSSTALSSDL